MEELVAEIGSAYLSADLGITPETREDHAVYVASWLKVLRDDKRAIFTAARHAERAADHLHGYQQEAPARQLAATGAGHALPSPEAAPKSEPEPVKPAAQAVTQIEMDFGPLAAAAPDPASRARFQRQGRDGSLTR
jgi:hypothetical protein